MLFLVGQPGNVQNIYIKEKKKTLAEALGAVWNHILP
jgi:hypothetical protein